MVVWSIRGVALVFWLFVVVWLWVCLLLLSCYFCFRVGLVWISVFLFALY